MLAINCNQSRPIYEQVKEELRRLIVSGGIAPGGKLPSVRELAGRLAINPNTIQRAYRELEAEGYIVSIPGKGSFACERGAEESARRAALLAEFDAVAAELGWLGVSMEALRRRLEGEKNGHET